MGWASGFSAGTNLGKTLVNTYNQASQEDELRKIANEKPVESTGFTADQGAQLEAAAKTGQYDIGYDQEAKAYTVTPKSDPSKTGMVSMQGVTDFMGNRTVGRLDESQVNNAKLRAMAGVLGKTDPLQSTRLMREVTQGERDDKRFGWEAGGQENKSKMADLQLRALEDAEKTKNMQRAIVEAVSNGPGAVDDLFNNQYPDGFTSKSMVGPDGKWTIARTDKSGKVVAENKFNTSIDLIGSVLASADPAKFVERAERKEKDAKAEARQGRLDDANIDESNAKATYYRSAAGAKANAAGPAEKLPAMVKLRAEGLQRAVAAAESAYNKGLAGGESPESPGMQTLLKNMRLAQDNLEGLISPYLPGERPTTSDVLGVGPPSPTGAAGAAKAPAPPPNGPVRQISKAQQAALDKDIPGILARERDAVLQRIAAGDERAKTDLASLDKEIARMDKRATPGKTASASRTPPSMTAVAVPAERQAPQVPSAPANPADAAGLRLDEARKQFQQASAAAQRYGLMQRRADPAGYERAVQAQALAGAALEKKKAEYERILQPTAQSAVMGRYARP